MAKSVIIVCGVVGVALLVPCLFGVPFQAQQYCHFKVGRLFVCFEPWGSPSHWHIDHNHDGSSVGELCRLGWVHNAR